ncbi:MAG: 50S ribosomal protein L3 [Nanoarchaeota archaeon]|nr:50S ribosomal protein L3 [Nanoarchaeota archaeon]
MAKLSSPRAGSLQFWPRKRAEKILPSPNWRTLNGKGKGILGFITYKVGMATALVKDNTADSITKGKKIVIPVTILEAPNMKVFSVRFYRNGQVIKDVIVSNDSDLKKMVKLPQQVQALDSQVPQEYDDIRLIVYSLPKQTSIKKTPDIAEIAFTADNKLDFVKGIVGKELSLKESFSSDLVDVRGLTTGKGLVGPVKRFGITLKQHKTEKGVRRPGSLSPWHPARVTFRTPMAGQLGMFTRVHYNLKVISQNAIADKDINSESGFKNYGKVKSNYILVKGSVQGPSKRQILITPSFRPTKSQTKKKYELIEVLK